MTLQLRKLYHIVKNIDNMSKKKEQKLPKWFNGELYTEGAEVTNPFSKESYELNNLLKVGSMDEASLNGNWGE